MCVTSLSSKPLISVFTEESMKKFYALLILLAILLTAAGSFEVYAMRTGTEVTISGTLVAEDPENDTEPLFSTEDYPKVDGSTATVPLAKAFQENFTGAQAEVTHSKTHEAYLSLIDGNCDLILVVEPSEEDLKYAEAKGVELAFDTIVNEGFVFFVNNENPVETLTANQIRNIYAGRITNWNEVGGKDLPIIPYQRPVNSGSQTAMLDLVMNGRKLKEAPKKNIMQSMSDIVDVVSNYENGEQAIGYSYYYYANTMYIGEHCRMLRVNDIEPSTENIMMGRYPFMTRYIAVTRKNDRTPETEALLSAMLSDRGQRAAAEAGYVPSRSMKDLPAAEERAAAGETFGVTAEDVYSENAAVMNTVSKTYRGQAYDFPVYDGLKDDAAENMINTKIEDTLQGLIDQAFYDAGEPEVLDNASVTVTVNANFANTLSLTLSFYSMEKKTFQTFGGTEYLNFDVSTGEDIDFYDLFPDDVSAPDVFSSGIYDTFVSMIAKRSFDSDKFWNERVTDYADIEEYELDLAGRFNARYPFKFYFSPRNAVIFDEVHTVNGKAAAEPFTILVPISFSAHPEKTAIYKRFLTTDTIFDGQYEALTGIPVGMNRAKADKTVLEITDTAYTDVIFTDIFKEEDSKKLYEYGVENVLNKIDEIRSEAYDAGKYPVISGRGNVYELFDKDDGGQDDYGMDILLSVLYLDTEDAYIDMKEKIMNGYRFGGGDFEMLAYGSNDFLNGFRTYDPESGQKTDEIEDRMFTFRIGDGEIRTSE